MIQNSNFLKKLVLFSAIIAAVSYFVYFYFIPIYYLQIFPFVLLFFMISTVAVHAVLMKSLEKRPLLFVNTFMLSTIVKLFVYLIFLVIYLAIDRANALIFTIYFLSLYFLYTGFEVVVILKEAGKNKR